MHALDRLPLDRVVIDLPAERYDYLWWAAEIRQVLRGGASGV